MRELVAAYEDPDIKETYTVACHGVSKTMTMALLVEYHVSVMGKPAITTAPTLRQANDLLWEQMRTNRVRAAERITLPGRILETPKLKNGAAKAWAFVPKTPDAAQGIHLDDLLIVVDEAAGVENWLWKAIVGWATNPGCQIFGIGNPNTLLSYFRSQFFEQRGKVDESSGKTVSRAIEISAHDSPNVTTMECGRPKTPEEQEVLPRPIPALASDSWLAKCAREWGKDSLDYWMKALGKWPETTLDERAIPMEWIQLGFKRTDDAIAAGILVDPDDDPFHRLSLDIARRGVDKCCAGGLTRQRYLKVSRYWDEPDTTKTLDYYYELIGDSVARSGEDEVEYGAIDGNALGGTACDFACKHKKENPEIWGSCEVNEVDWGANPEGSEKKDKAKRRSRKGVKKTPKAQFTTMYVSRLYWNLRQALNPSKPPEELIYLPTEKSLRKAGLTRDQFAAQMNARKCWRNEYGQWFVEPKHKLKERTKEMKGATSCDVADMGAMCFDDTFRRKKRGLRFARR